MRFESRIGLGTVQFGIPYGISNSHGQTSEAEVEEILTRAKTYGIFYLDTASAYGCSEAVLGKNDITHFKVISKFMPPENGDGISLQLENSLNLLNINSLYGYLAHDPQDLLKNREQWLELEKLVSQGMISKIGFSFNDPAEIEMALLNNMIPDLVQVPFNYLDNRFTPYLKILKEKGCEIHTRSTFLQGLFFCDPSKLDPYFDEVKPCIESLQAGYNNKLAALLLKYCLSQPFIDCVVIGINSADQLNDNINNLIDLKLSEVLSEHNYTISQKILTPPTWPKN